MKQGWEKKKLDDVCLIKGRIGYRGYTKNDLVNKGEGAISLSPSNIKDNRLFFDNCTYISWDKYNESPEIMIYEGDIIFCKTASIGKMALVDYLPEKATLNPQFVVLKNISCSNKYLYYFMICEDFKKQVNNIISGTAVPTLSQKNLGNLKLPLPPLPEQQRIVSILDEAFAAIAKAKANAEQNLRNAKELFESYLQGVFEKKGDGWEETHLSKVCDFENGDRGKNYPNKSHRVSLGIPFINAGHLNENRLNFSDMDYISEERFNMLGNGKIKPNDILFCLRGSLGKVANVGNLNKGSIASSLVILRVKNELDNDFLLYFLNSNLTKKQIVDFGNGAAQPNLSAASLKKFIIPFPKSKEEQQTIVCQLDALRAETQKLEVVYQKKIADLEELKKSILQKAFAGELK